MGRWFLSDTIRMACNTSDGDVFGFMAFNARFHLGAVFIYFVSIMCDAVMAKGAPNLRMFLMRKR
jgi:hypothetical protein